MYKAIIEVTDKEQNFLLYSLLYEGQYTIRFKNKESFETISMVIVLLILLSEWSRKHSHNISSFLSFCTSCCDDRNSDCVHPHVVEDPDVTDRVRYQRVDAHDEVEKEEL